MSKTYTNEEILERLKSLEGLLLERVFETSYSESLRTYDLIDHLRSKAHDLGLEGEDTYTALIRDLEKLSSTIGGLINGKRGELLAAKSVLVLGSGGASQAIRAALEEVNAHVSVISRTGVDTYETLLERHSDAALIVNI